MQEKFINKTERYSTQMLFSYFLTTSLWYHRKVQRQIKPIWL